MRLLIVEDNERLARLTREGLERRGLVCDEAHSLDAANAALDCVTYDAIILDLGLPDGDGLHWLKQRRRDGMMVPALMLTARGALEDRIDGLDAGADDYVVKPAETDEIAARIRALLRRPGVRALPLLEVGPLTFDCAARRASVDGVTLDLSRRESDLLELLMREAGSVVRRDRIETSLYNFEVEISPNALEAVVSRLRRRLDEGAARNMLHTIRGLGYMLEDRGQ